MSESPGWVIRPTRSAPMIRRVAGQEFYTFQVRGRLSERMVQEFCPMSAEEAEVVTVLTGYLDEAAAHGMIERLRRFGLDLVSMQRQSEAGRPI